MTTQKKRPEGLLDASAYGRRTKFYRKIPKRAQNFNPPIAPIALEFVSISESNWILK